MHIKLSGKQILNLATQKRLYKLWDAYLHTFLRTNSNVDDRHRNYHEDTKFLNKMIEFHNLVYCKKPQKLNVEY